MMSITHHSLLPDYNYLICYYCSDTGKGNPVHTLSPDLSIGIDWAGINLLFTTLYYKY